MVGHQFQINDIQITTTPAVYNGKWKQFHYKRVIRRWEFIKENKKVRIHKNKKKKENKNSTKKATKKKRMKTRTRPRKKEKTFFS